MEYIIFIAIALTALTGYHLFRYKKSGYQKFEYYLNGETNFIVGFLVASWTIILTILTVALFVYLGGQLVKIFI